MALEIHIDEISNDVNRRPNFLYDPNIAEINVLDTDQGIHLPIERIKINQVWKYEFNNESRVKIDLNPIANKWARDVYPRFSIERKTLINEYNAPVELYTENIFLNIIIYTPDGQTAQTLYRMHKNLFGFRNWGVAFDNENYPILANDPFIVLPTGIEKKQIKFYKTRSGKIYDKILTIWTGGLEKFDFDKNTYSIHDQRFYNVRLHYPEITGIDADENKITILTPQTKRPYTIIDDDCYMLYFQTEVGTIEQLPFKKVDEKLNLKTGRNIDIGNPMRNVYDLPEWDITIFAEKKVTKQIKLGRKLDDDYERILIKNLMRTSNVWIEYPNGYTRKVEVKEKQVPDFMNDIILTIDEKDKNYHS